MAKLPGDPPGGDGFAKRVIDGARTRDPKDHNLVLCQLSYDHRVQVLYPIRPMCQL